MKAITNARIVQTDHIIPDGVILYEGGKIVDFGEDLPVGDAEVTDVGGAFVGPGLIDIHTHSDGQTFFFEDPAKAAATVLRRGVTSVLPALYFNAPKTELIRQINVIRAAMTSGGTPNIFGLYMEAPYLNPKFGGNRENNPWRGEIDERDYADIFKAASGLAKVWCVAPERRGVEDFVRYVKLRDPNARFAVAHSEATPEEIERLIKYGLCLATHHTNATGTLQKHPECRTPCVDETAWYHRDIYAEMICDRVGIHVDPYMQRLIRRIKGDDRVILISDAFPCDGPIPAGYEKCDDINFDHAGEIAGTALVLDKACRNMMMHTGASLCEVFRFAAANPAEVLGLPDRGKIEIGRRADLLAVDAEFHPLRVMLGGEWVD